MAFENGCSTLLKQHCRVNHIEELINALRQRGEIVVREKKDSWLASISKGDFTCEITIPKTCFEWFAAVKRNNDQQEVWSDWMEHYDQPREQLDQEMAESISSFIDRVIDSELKLPLEIYKPKP